MEKIIERINYLNNEISYYENRLTTIKRCHRMTQGAVIRSLLDSYRAEREQLEAQLKK